MSIKDLAEMIDTAFGISLTLGGILWMCLYFKLDKIYDELKERNRTNDVISKKVIQAIQNDLNECYSDCENETDKAFQQGRISAHKHDLFVIDQILSEGEKMKND